MSISDEIYRRVVEAVPEGIWVVDPAGRTIFSNQRMADILGVDFAAIPEQCFGCVYPDELEDAQRHFARALGGDRRPFDFRLRRGDGSPVWVSISCMPFCDEQGAQAGMLGLFADITERKRAEEALRESEERFRQIADTAPVMIWMSGPDQLSTFFNRPWLEFTGRTMEEELGKGWASGVHADDLDACVATYAESFEARKSFQMEYRLRRADGEYRWVLDSGTPRHRSGEFIGFIGSCIDVTEKKQIEERVRGNEARLMDAQRLANVGSWKLDIESGKIQWSDEMFRIFGLPEDAQPDFQTFLNLIHPKDRKAIAENQARARSSTAPVSGEFRVIRPDGSVRFVRSILEAIRNEAGEAVGFAGAAQDITDQVLARELLGESEKRLRDAERLAQAGNWHYDAVSGQVVCSEGMLRILGMPPDRVPARSELLDAVLPEDRERLHAWGADCLAGKGPPSTEFRFVRPNGELRTVTCTSEAIRNEDGLAVRLVGSCQDVTESRRAQDEAFRRQKLESVGTLASGIAHDFNNLLGGVLAHADLAMLELEAGARPEEELRQIRKVAIHGAEIVRQLMIYAGKESDVAELVEVSRLVGEMVDLLRVSVSKRVALEAALGEGLPAVRATAAQVRQIVMNLVINASEAMGDRDGVIRVSTGRITLDRAAGLAKGAAAGEYLVLEVADTGSGIPPEALARVFDPFFTTKASGRGLGLAVVHGTVRGLGGSIHLTSDRDKGARFQVLLPAVADGVWEAAAPPAAEEEPGRQETATILVVEDEEALRRPLVTLLRRRGFEVLEAATGTLAIDLLRARGGQVEAMLLDMSLPGASSQEVVAEAELARPDMKVILTSAYSEETATGNVRSPLIRRFVRKPFQIGDLVATIRSALSS